MCLIFSSFVSTKSMRFLKLADRIEGLDLVEPDPISSTSPSTAAGRNLRYWQRILQKNTVRERKHATPQIRNRPQKLVRDSRSESTSFIWIEHSLCVSHLLWIFWRSPFSESWRMAVDKSTARGESLWNAWDKETEYENYCFHSHDYILSIMLPFLSLRYPWGK